MTVTAGLVTALKKLQKTVAWSGFVLFCSSGILTPFGNSPNPSYLKRGNFAFNRHEVALRGSRKPLFPFLPPMGASFLSMVMLNKGAQGVGDGLPCLFIVPG